jgi:RNase P protein component
VYSSKRCAKKVSILFINNLGENADIYGLASDTISGAVERNRVEKLLRHLASIISL